MEENKEIHQKPSTKQVDQDKAKSHSTDLSTETCVICLESVSDRAAASPCNHDSFDFLCLVSWLQERSICPLCKTEVLAVDYSWNSPNGHKTYTIPQDDGHKDATAHTSNEPLRNPNPRLRPNGRNLRAPRQSRPRLLLNPDAALLRRRQIYAQKSFSLHVGTNRLSRFRDLSPRIFSQDDELIRRARKWIRRELRVFGFLDTDGQDEEGITRRTNNAEFLLEYIIAILKTVDIKGSEGQAEDMLQDFLGRENTQLFLHELKSWLRSPYTSLEDWDRHVQYAVVPHIDSPGVFE
ncbi:MAG: hypothetical protein Q9200_001083 [Gallowayella weberi]